jgi:hypothetical protein
MSRIGISAAAVLVCTWVMAMDAVQSEEKAAVVAERAGGAPEEFPRFEVPGFEAEMRSLEELFWLHYQPAGPLATLWDEWMSKSSLWPAVEERNQMRRRWSEALLGRRMDGEGYVSTHQHEGLGHPEGWPFPLWTQGEGIGWHFSVAGSPYGEELGIRATQPEGWELHGAEDRGTDEKEGWRLELTEAGAWVQTPGFEVAALHVPLVRVMWKVEGLVEGEDGSVDGSPTLPRPLPGREGGDAGQPLGRPYVEWTTVEQPEFGPERRMYFAPAGAGEGMVTTVVPLYQVIGRVEEGVGSRQKADGREERITGLRIHFDNAPGVRVTLKGVVTAYDTRHNVNNSNFIQGSYHYFAWTRDLEFLQRNINRMRVAMRYMMEAFQTLERGVVVTPWVGHDGRSGILYEDGEKIIRKGLGIGNNYWDLLPFGGEDALATIYYYDAVLKLADLEEQIAGNPGWNVPSLANWVTPGARGLHPPPAPPSREGGEAERPAEAGRPVWEELRAHAEQVRERFQERFWNDQTGRFVPAVDLIEGRQMGDYGLTFLNTEAVYYGLASEEQAESIVQWLTGERVVEGDTAQGDEIYHWRFAPRSTTKRNIEYYGFYWHGPEFLNFGDQVQDGGAVLGFSYHDLQTRLMTRGADDAWGRLREIIAWFDEVQSEGGYREYYSKPGRGTLQGGGPPGGLGMDREFFESILVPQIMLYGFLGFEPRGNGFAIDPKLPGDWPSLRISRIHLHDKVLGITSDRERIRVEAEAPIGSRFEVYLPAGRWSIRYGERGSPPVYQHTEEVSEGQALTVPVHASHPIEFIRVDVEAALRGIERPMFGASDERAGLLLSRMWEIFGEVDPDAVIRFGNEPAWYEWLALKLAWTDLERDKQVLRNKYASWPMNEEGYLWSWANEEGWPTHHGRHYENNAKYIMGVCRYYFWTGDESFLEQVDETTAESRFPEQVDVSEGMTILEKTRRAMEYQLDELNGREGILRIDDPKADGTVDGLPGDYWDNYRFGYLSGYTNVYFYGSLLALAELEGALGNPDRRDDLLEIAGEVKRKFNELFWDEEKGRYIGCIDVEGNRWDFGFTYVNVEALFYGLADEGEPAGMRVGHPPPAPPSREGGNARPAEAGRPRAERVFEWLDGERIVESDLQEVNGRMTGSVGEDIYAFGFAPRANTRAVESIEIDGKYWWWDINGAITVGGVARPSAQYGEHLENGGAIFYVSFYDVMSRLRVLGPDAAWERMEGILEEFGYDELRRRPANNVGANWTHGVLGPFPESGLVPTAFLHGFMGLEALGDRLVIAPRLPAALEWGEVDRVVYRGAEYSVRARRNGEGRVVELSMRSEGAGEMRLDVGSLVPGGEYELVLDGQREVVQVSEAGRFVVEVDPTEASHPWALELIMVSDE